MLAKIGEMFKTIVEGFWIVFMKKLKSIGDFYV
ncbi:hypothetical protein SAMN05428962_4463 [Paenibacillus sp. BC26]|nr:hypothetical protein SAMN05428962_4463 [Paenibacillus sp. BC26]